MIPIKIFDSYSNSNLRLALIIIIMYEKLVTSYFDNSLSIQIKFNTKILLLNYRPIHYNDLLLFCGREGGGDKLVLHRPLAKKKTINLASTHTLKKSSLYRISSYNN